MTFSRRTIASFRAEERRKLLGKHPYEEYSTLDNSALAKKIMRTMKAEITVEMYTRNVALLRLFIYEDEDKSQQQRGLYTNFKQWHEHKFPKGISEDIWDTILQMNNNEVAIVNSLCLPCHL